MPAAAIPTIGGQELVDAFRKASVRQFEIGKLLEKWAEDLEVENMKQDTAFSEEAMAIIREMRRIGREVKKEVLR